MTEEKTFGKRATLTMYKTRLLSEDSNIVCITLFKLDDIFETINPNMYKKLKSILHTCLSKHRVSGKSKVNECFKFKDGKYYVDLSLYKLIDLDTNEEFIHVYVNVLLDKISIAQKINWEKTQKMLREKEKQRNKVL